MLTASITLHRKPKDGTDGVGITSADVVFAIGESKTTSPTTGWITNFSGLTLESGKYVWTCTKTTLTKGTSYYTGAYCLGECYDFAQVVELYALSDSSTNPPDVAVFRPSYEVVKGKYLWSCVKVTYNDANISYLNKKCVSYFPNDGINGTKFTPKGTAYDHYSKASELPTPSIDTVNRKYLVDIDDKSTPTRNTPCVCYYKNTTTFMSDVAAEGDVYNIGGTLWVHDGKVWHDFGSVQGPKGDDGEDAINIVFSPAELVFDADENGNLKQAEKSAEIKVYRGTTELHYKTDWDNDAEFGDNCRAALLVNTTTNKPEVKISEIKSSMIDDVKVPATSGGANVSVIVDGVKYRAYLPFSVNVNTYANFLIRDNKKYISKYTEVSNKYDAVSTELNNKANKSDLKTVETTIEQTAENIKLEVLSKTSGRRNMLVNSAFRNQDSVLIHSLARIEKNTGVDSVNCIHSSDKYSGTGEGNCIGAFWDSTQKNGVVTNIPIVKGKKYVFSCWIKSDNLDLPFNIECFYMKSINQQSRADAKGAKSESFKVTERNKWQKITCVLDTNNADATEYLAVNFWSNNKNVPKAIGADEYPTCNAYICKPMMEEGDTYGGWTLSDGDYDYVGGNMIDNARTLEVGGSLKSLNPNGLPDYERAYYGDCMALRIKNTNANNTYLVMEFATDSMELDVDYIFSFLAKGKASIGLYAQCDRNAEGDSVFSEDSVNQGTRLLNVRYASIIELPNQLTTEYKRYWGHMRFHGYLPSKLYIQLNGAGEVYVCQPKLEKGATMTEFTERKTDLVDKASLKKAGIEITTDKVKLYGDKVEVVTTTKNEDGTSTDTQTAMFSNGKLNANLIDADKIEVKHLWAKSEDGTTKVGYFGNYEIEACKVDDTTYAPLFVGGDTASQSSFYVSSEGAMYATSGYIGGFNIGKTSIDGINGQNKVMLTPGYISFDNKTHGIDNIIGANWKYGLDYVGQQIVVKYDHATPSYGGNIGIANLKNIALYVSASGNIDRLSRDTGVVNSVYPCGNHAIFCDKGDFAGFRPCFRIITSSQALSKYDVVVEIVETWKKHNSITGEDTSVEVGPVTISLPTNPEIGQMYWIIRSTRHDYSMKTTDGTQIYTPGGVTTFYTFKTQNEMVCVVYTGSNWRVMWNMGV
jgi:hypothetical protein